MIPTTAPIQLVYASHDGHTEQIALRLAAEWRRQGLLYSLFNLSETEADPFLWPEPSTIVVMSPIRYGFHLPVIDTFIEENKEFLKEQRLVMISVNLTARKAMKSAARTNPYYKRWIARHELKPTLGAVLAGRLVYAKYKPWEKAMIRLIMAMTGGPTNLDADIDYTPWLMVDALARQIAKLSAKREAA